MNQAVDTSAAQAATTTFLTSLYDACRSTFTSLCGNVELLGSSSPSPSPSPSPFPFDSVLVVEALFQIVECATSSLVALYSAVVAVLPEFQPVAAVVAAETEIVHAIRESNNYLVNANVLGVKLNVPLTHAMAGP